ncbi:glycoside hydrolase family 128 protein [Whalleya microplaca]|nr:glycoside hydrolase family 128 protein [Whalleya microplaca]
MVLLQSIRFLACFITSISFLSPTQAIPIVKSDLISPRVSGGKRIILWEWTLTQDLQLQKLPQLLTAITTLSSSSVITSITNWETWRPTELPKKLKFRPMVRTKQHLSGENWNNLLSVAKSQKNTIVHFFNEPERNGIDATDAANIWKQNMVPLRKQYNIKLVAPGCASSQQGSQWLDTFMKQLGKDEQPDYLNLHFYTTDGNPVDQEIQSGKTYLSGRHDTYKLPVIVGEIASTSRNANDVDKFSKDLAQWLDSQNWVVEYGLYGVSCDVSDSFVSPVAQLLDSNGAWTALGRWWIGE